MTTTGTIHIVDDDGAVCESMALFLSQRGYRVSCHNCVDAFFADRVRQGADEEAVVISDMRMPGRSGLSLLRDLRSRAEPTDRPPPVIIITGQASVPVAVDSMRLGAVHFLEKPVDPDVLLETVAAAFDTLRADSVTASSASADARLQSLTRREREVLAAFVARGSNKAVATLLNMSPRTVEVHRTRIFRKSGANNVPELVRIAIEAGVLQKSQGRAS